MKEERFFYQPDLDAGELTKEDTQHAVRVLRMKAGDEMWLMDGRGTFCRARITAASNHRCAYCIEERLPQESAWQGSIHLAMAPTKLNERTEWLAEKATEIGMDRLSFLDCQFSERHSLKVERIDKIVVAAMKQSRKAWKPQVDEIEPFEHFISRPFAGDKFICHCYEGEKPNLFECLLPGRDALVMIGPEGDFSLDEVRLAEQHGFKAVTLGKSRLRTETAALVAVHMMQLKNQK